MMKMKKLVCVKCGKKHHGWEVCPPMRADTLQAYKLLLVTQRMEIEQLKERNQKLMDIIVERLTKERV